MSDTLKSILPNHGSRKRVGPFLVDKKPRASGFTPRIEQDIVYRFAWQRLEPKRIAERLSTGPVRATTADIHEVLRRKVRDSWGPSGGGGGLKAA